MTPNLMPGRDREVSVAATDGPLTEPALRELLGGREAYRHTRFVAVRGQRGTALVEVERGASDPLFAPITSLRLVVGPADCTWLDAPDVDTSVPSQLAEVALRRAPQVRGVVVSGRYGHVGFIVDPRPVELRVVDVVPPEPPKLVDQVRRVLDTAEDLPPIVLRAELVDLRELARRVPADTYLFPCRAGGSTVPGRRTAFLDERPPREDWVLVGCARSRELHRWFYGDLPPNVDSCPRELAVPGVPTLTKCCLLDRGTTRDGSAVVVPWGASLAEVHAALERVVREVDPAWAPA